MADAAPTLGRAAAAPSRRRAVWGGLALAVLLVTLCVLVPTGQRHWQERQRIELGERLLQGGTAGDARTSGAGDVASVLPGRLHRRSASQYTFAMYLNG